MLTTFPLIGREISIPTTSSYCWRVEVKVDLIGGRKETYFYNGSHKDIARDLVSISEKIEKVTLLKIEESWKYYQNDSDPIYNQALWGDGGRWWIESKNESEGKFAYLRKKIFESKTPISASLAASIIQESKEGSENLLARANAKVLQ